ncbi:tol-pal system protein YbgF [Tranquillimonas rosea]|uniref:Cell division coordinator CpoB n=1 Tax=Tranquillimonas rosea TaxID=641238 RepID=A0A1H9UVE0_9RHOB|nr:tol-pal system protein YbgF [Tranquillimonas rosea]SES13435.1 tol-pal system protein YbgF [Tranquillimonas rosea]
MLRALLIAALLLPGVARAQSAPSTETLADVRQELSILYVEVQKLKRQLSTTGTPQVDLSGTSALERIDAMERELQRLTARTEEIEFRVNQVVEDGTNRVGDLEFRLCELEEDCDISELGDTPQLGGDMGEALGPSAPQQASPPSNGAQMAIGEQDDFDAAKAAFDSGDYSRAADLFETFTTSYTGGPLTAQAHYFRGEALSQLDRTSDAARAYLAAFSGSPQGERAPQALLQLGLSLSELGQNADACVTLGEVTSRFPDSSASVEAQAARADMTCQ